MTLGQRIYNRMKNLNLTQAELSKKSDITQQVISCYIHNSSKPGYNSIIGLMKGLETKAEWFFEQTDEEEPKIPYTQTHPKLKQRITQLEESIEQLLKQKN